MTELQEGAFYMVPEKAQNRVVRLRAVGERHVVAVEAEGPGRWTLDRERFAERVRDGYIQEVRPRWEPAGDEVVV